MTTSINLENDSNNDSNRKRGRIRAWRWTEGQPRPRGFGFVETASGEEFFLHSVYVHRGLAPANGKLVEFTVSDKEEKGPRRCRKAVDARVIPEILQDRIDVAAEVGYALSPETIAKIRVILAQSNEPIPVAASS